MRRAACIFALATVLAFPAHARLGETQAESIARYGPDTGSRDVSSTDDRYTTLAFYHAGFTIIAQFKGDRCEMICFQKPDRSAFTPAELDLLLKAQAEGQAWSRSTLVSSDVIFDRPDGAMARYDTTKHALAFLSAAYLKTANARQKADQKRQIENL